MMKINLIVICIVIFTFLSSLSAQQYPDTTYSPPVFEARYDAGEGPVVYIDEAHNNFHTLDGRYSPFASVVEFDGYRVEAFTSEFSRRALKDKRMLVIANALPDNSVSEWISPTQSAFTEKEIRTLRKWIRRGGSLFLIAEYMPFGGAASALAAEFGYIFYDGFADDTMTRRSVELFTTADGTLADCAVTRAGRGMLRVDSISTFTGQVFKVPEDAESVLNCGAGWRMALPDTAWVFTKGLEIIDATGFSQGAIQRYGRGKLAFFGEAGMFTAQVAVFDAGEIRMGMNNFDGRNNFRLLVNIIRWMDEE